jgi:hypothetical protein
MLTGKKDGEFGSASCTDVNPKLSLLVRPMAT